LKKQIDEDIGSREVIAHKLKTVDELFKNMESDFEKSRSMNELIKFNIDRSEEIITAMKDEVEFFETKNTRSNDRSNKTLVKIKISLDATVNELSHFKKETNKKISSLSYEIGNNVINKKNIESNFENIIES